MKARIMVAALVAVILSAAASTASGSVRTSKATSITVWLMGDAQSGWPNVVAEANAAFKAKHPGVDVKVQYQTWGDHLTKFDATIAGGDTPDVLEFGNSERREQRNGPDVVNCQHGWVDGRKREQTAMPMCAAERIS